MVYNKYYNNTNYGWCPSTERHRDNRKPRGAFASITFRCAVPGNIKSGRYRIFCFYDKSIYCDGLISLSCCNNRWSRNRL